MLIRIKLELNVRDSTKVINSISSALHYTGWHFGVSYNNN